MFDLVKMLLKANVLLLLTNAFVFVYAGEYFLYNTTTSHYYMSQLGIDINKTNTLRLEIRAPYDQLLRLLDKPVTDSSAVFLEIVFNHNYIGVRENCEGCAITAYKQVKTFDDKQSKRFWVTWDASGVTRIGLGYHIDTDEQIGFQPTSSFPVQFISLRSFYSTGYCTVVKDDPPIVIQPSSLSLTTINVNETLPITTEIISVNVTDPENDVVNVISDSRHFQMSNFTLILAEALDYEQETSHNVTLSFRDDWNEVHVTLFIRVVDEIDEPPSLNIVQNLLIPEELPIGTPISLLMNVTDKDRNDSFTYQISGNDSSMFSIDPSNGTITVATRIDRDGVSGLVNLAPITITVIDLAGLENEQTLNITITDINDNPPTCHPLSANVSIYENGSNDTIVLVMNCTDLDDVESANLSYAVNATNILQDLLYFNGTTLMIDSTSLDLESVSEENYQFSITVNDSWNSSRVHTASIQFNLMILGKNEYAPAFYHVRKNNSLQDVSILDITDINQTISSVRAYDLDAGEDGEILYRISSFASCNSSTNTSDNNIFHIHQNTGDISLSQSAMNMSGCFQLDINAIDKGNPPKNQTVSLHIFIQETLAYQPSFEKDFYRLHIDCDQSIDSLLTTINVSNFQPYNLTYYTIRQNVEENYISIERNTGSVILKSRPEGDELHRSVAEVQVFNTHNVKLSSSVFLVSTFEPCVSSDITTTTTTRSTISATESSSATSSYSIDDFLEDMKVFGLKALCAFETVVLVCIGITYLAKKYPCRNREVHPSKPTMKIDTVSQGTSRSQLSSNISNTSTVTTRCSSIESLRLV